MVPTGTKEMTISYIGYKTMTVPIEPIIKVTMEEDTSAMVDCYVMVPPLWYPKKIIFTGLSGERSQTLCSQKRVEFIS